jgi:hypothetical protein
MLRLSVPESPIRLRSHLQWVISAQCDRTMTHDKALRFMRGWCSIKQSSQAFARTLGSSKLGGRRSGPSAGDIGAVYIHQRNNHYAWICLDTLNTGFYRVALKLRPSDVQMKRGMLNTWIGNRAQKCPWGHKWFGCRFCRARCARRGDNCSQILKGMSTAFRDLLNSSSLVVKSGASNHITAGIDEGARGQFIRTRVVKSLN